jgi:hypothetical protein
MVFDINIKMLKIFVHLAAVFVAGGCPHSLLLVKYC